MMPPFNAPNVDESGFYVPFFSNPFGPGASRRRSSASSRPSSRSRAAASAPTRSASRCAAQVARVDPNLPLYFVGTPKAQIDGFVAQNRIIATMFSIFGVVAMVLASVGMYGVMSFSVNQRRAGVRRAHGARRALQPHPADGAAAGGVQLAIGLGLGLGLALALATVAGGRDPEHPVRRQRHATR